MYGSGLVPGSLKTYELLKKKIEKSEARGAKCFGKEWRWLSVGSRSGFPIAWGAFVSNFSKSRGAGPLNSWSAS